jgi:hypothetical protein
MTDPSPAETRDPSSRIAAHVVTLLALMWRVLEAGLLLIGLIVLVYLLLGTGSGAFVQGVIANIQSLVAAVTPQALIGVAIVLAIIHLARRR